jgi:hypothetical protein
MHCVTSRRVPIQTARPPHRLGTGRTSFETSAPPPCRPISAQPLGIQGVMHSVHALLSWPSCVLNN